MKHRHLLIGALTTSFCLTPGASSVLAQTYPASDAFAESYAAESAYDYTKAIKVLKSVYDQESYELNLRLGWLSYLSGQYDKSLEYYEKAARIMPCSIEARRGCILPAAALANWQAVSSCYHKILEIDPHNCNANYYLGLIAYNKSEYATSLTYLERVLNLYPFDYDTIILCAWSNYRLGKKAQARDLFRRALLRVPDDPSALSGLNLTK